MLVMRRGQLVFMASIALLSTTGCGEKDLRGRLPVHPASGSVTFQGAPAAGAQLTFFGQEEELKGRGKPLPRAVVDEDGKFKITSYESGDGAPVGTYKVTIYWPAEPAEGEDPDDEFYEAEDRLGGKYKKLKETPLEIKIAEGSNKLEPFELTN